jgi:hypothetical protein
MRNLLPAIGAFALVIVASPSATACSLVMWEDDYGWAVARQKEASQVADSIVLARLKRFEQSSRENWYRDVLSYETLLPFSGASPPRLIVSVSEGDDSGCYYPGPLRVGDLAVLYLRQDRAGIIGKRTTVTLAIPLDHNRLAETGDLIRAASPRGQGPALNP